MINQKIFGYIFKDRESGKFLNRTLVRGSFDKSYYKLSLHDKPEMATIFEDDNIDNPYKLEYRNIFAEKILSDLESVKVVKIWDEKSFGRIEKCQ